MQLTILVLSICIFPPHQVERTPEQIAVDYFFENTFQEKFSEYKKLEFNTQTISDRYSGIINHCEDFNPNLINDIKNTAPESTIMVNSSRCPIRTKKPKSNSSRLQIDVYSRIELKDEICVLLTAYRKLRFVEYYFVIMNNIDLEVIGVCNVGEII
jgi:hypothetical protein